MEADNHLTEKGIPENAFRELSSTRKSSGKYDATFLESEMFACSEKHQKSFSGALPGAFRARKVFGSFENRTPGFFVFSLFFVFKARALGRCCN